MREGRARSGPSFCLYAVWDSGLAIPPEPFEIGDVLRATRLFRFDEIAEAQIRHTNAANPPNDAARIRLVEGDAPRDCHDVDTRVIPDDGDRLVSDFVGVEFRRDSVRQLAEGLEELCHVPWIGRNEHIDVFGGTRSAVKVGGDATSDHISDAMPVEKAAHAQDAVIGTTDSFAHASNARRPQRSRTT